jgi:putative DNA primase/helicase
MTSANNAILKPVASEPWENIDLPDGYVLSNDGVFKKQKEDSIRISGFIWVYANTEDINTGLNGVVVKFIDSKGRERKRAFPKGIFFEQNNSLVIILVNEGLSVVPGKEKLLKEYLGSFESVTWINSVSSIGWLDIPDGELAYLFPSSLGVIGSGKQEEVIYQPEQYSPSVDTITSKGTLEDWQNNVAALCEGNPFLIASLCVSFAAVLLKHSELQNAGFHYYGDSSTGKTTAAQVAASCIGCGADPSDTPDKAYIQRWNSTENALEGLLYAHNDAPLILDEIQTYSGKDFGRAIHNITSGRSKSRMTKYSSLQQLKAWRVLLFSTGEISTRQKIEEESKQVHAGMSVRLIDIPVHKGIINDAHDKTSDEFVRLLKSNCSRYYGSAIPHFIKQLTSDYENSFALRGTISAELERVSNQLTPSNVESVHRRAIKHFALLMVAGEMAVKLGVIPLSTSEIKSAIETVVQEWLLHNFNLSDRRRGVENIKTFMIRERVKFAEIRGGDVSPVPQQAGYHKMHQGNDLFLFTEPALREACGEYDCHQVLKEIDKSGCLFTNNGKKKVSTFSIPGFEQRQPYYAIHAKLLSEENEEGHEVHG